MSGAGNPAKPRVVICGDSVFDNTIYVRPGERDVHSFLKEYADDWEVDFRAVDGAVCRHVGDFQINSEEPSCDAVVMSIGGNNALGELDRLFDPNKLVLRDHAHLLGLMQDEFRSEYREALRSACAVGRHILVATIYRPRFHLDPTSAPFDSFENIQMTLDPLLSVFNDVVQEEARRVRASVLDLRLICDRDEHFANPIEPSELGGRQIAENVGQWLRGL